MFITSMDVEGVRGEVEIAGFDLRPVEVWVIAYEFGPVLRLLILKPVEDPLTQSASHVYVVAKVPYCITATYRIPNMKSTISKEKVIMEGARDTSAMYCTRVLGKEYREGRLAGIRMPLQEIEDII